MTRILIVDDQPSFRRRLRQLLAQAGLTVVGEAGDIPQAKELVLKLNPDLAVVDVILPGESGVDGTPQLTALAPCMRVILVSAYHDQVLRKKAVESGADGFYPKDDLELGVVAGWRSTADNKA
jgi:NarL family two-component system response regulator LiaR